MSLPPKINRYKTSTDPLPLFVFMQLWGGKIYSDCCSQDSMTFVKHYFSLAKFLLTNAIAGDV